MDVTGPVNNEHCKDVALLNCQPDTFKLFFFSFSLTFGNWIKLLLVLMILQHFSSLLGTFTLDRVTSCPLHINKYLIYNKKWQVQIIRWSSKICLFVYFLIFDQYLYNKLYLNESTSFLYQICGVVFSLILYR